MLRRTLYVGGEYQPFMILAGLSGSLLLIGFLAFFFNIVMSLGLQGVIGIFLRRPPTRRTSYHPPSSGGTGVSAACLKRGGPRDIDDSLLPAFFPFDQGSRKSTIVQTSEAAPVLHRRRVSISFRMRVRPASSRELPPRRSLASVLRLCVPRLVDGSPLMSQTDQPADALPSHEDVHLSAFFEQAVDGMMLLTCNGDIVRVNQAFAAMHGYASPEEMLSIRLEELDAPPSTGLAAQCVARAAAGERLIFEAEHFRKDGTVFPVSVTASRVAVGEQWFLLAFHRDITGYKRAEAALRDSEHHLRLALEVGSIGVFDVELGTGRSSWSTGIQDLWAVPEGFAGDFASYCWEHIHPEDLDRVKAFYTKVVESGQVDECEFRVVHSDGTFRWLRWRGGAVVDAHTGGIRIVGVNIDITERKRLEVEREAALVKYRTLFDVLPLGVTVADRSGHIVESNRLAGELARGFSERTAEPGRRRSPMGDHSVRRHADAPFGVRQRSRACREPGCAGRRDGPREVCDRGRRGLG